MASTLRFAWYVLSADGPRDSWLMLTGMGAVVVLSVGFVRRSPATIAAGLGFSFLTPSLVIWYVWPLLIAGVIGFATQTWHQHTSTR